MKYTKKYLIKALDRAAYFASLMKGEHRIIWSTLSPYTDLDKLGYCLLHDKAFDKAHQNLLILIKRAFDYHNLETKDE